MSFQLPASLMSKVAKVPAKKQLLDRIVRQFEIYSYFAEKVPTNITDEDWEHVLQLKSNSDRVTYWNYLALTERRIQLDLEKKRVEKEKADSFEAEQRALYDSGGMGYGTNMYRHVLSPIRAKHNNILDLDKIYASRALSTELVKDMPKMLLDVQYVSTMNTAMVARVGMQVSSIIENQRNNQRPFPLEIINMDLSAPNMEKFFSYLGYYHRKEPVAWLPELHSGNPYFSETRYSADQPEEEQVIYLTRYAKDILDGPLRHKAYIMPITFDRNQESVGVCRMNNFRAKSLPLDKYVKWQSGRKALPFETISNIFTDLCSNGGNWESSFRKNIAAHHFVPMTELLKKADGHALKKRESKENLLRLVKLIDEADQRYLEETLQLKSRTA